MSAPIQSPFSAVEVQHISFSYPTRSDNSNRRLYENFSLNVALGSILALMGPSGSGKTTLGRIMAGILVPQAGDVCWSPHFSNRWDIVYVDQHPFNSVFPWLTVAENINRPMKKLGWEGARRKERICYLMSLLRMSGLADAYPASLSGGELQRLALARCLSWKPQLVILDEPFSALDRKVKAEIMVALQELAANDCMTLLLITHSVSDALALGTHCVVIGQRPVRIISDLEFRTAFPGGAGTPDYDGMQQALIAGIRDGLV
jgi:ABC-type nitrate/sulfonate/bicarbonate transport system ATPase subunit